MTQKFKKRLPKPLVCKYIRNCITGKRALTSFSRTHDFGRYLKHILNRFFYIFENQRTRQQKWQNMFRDFLKKVNVPPGTLWLISLISEIKQHFSSVIYNNLKQGTISIKLYEGGLLRKEIAFCIFSYSLQFSRKL